MEDYQKVLDYWFGQVESTITPSPTRTEIWFGQSPEIDDAISHRFGYLLERAIDGHLDRWENHPRSSLALIIVLDQFSRHIYHDMPQAYAQDGKALKICLEGIENEMEHSLSLIERVFYYFPLLHSEDIEMQATGVRGMELVLELAMRETKPLFKQFMEYAVNHYKVINQFGRFPHRNRLLGRNSTEAELSYLKTYRDQLND